MTSPGYAIYVHIPICAHKCYYCDFHSRPVDPLQRLRYLQALKAEIDHTPWRGSHATSLFLGGGTPSELTGDEIEELVNALSSAFQFDDDAEWTIECNPGTLNPASCDRLAELGFDRVSLGIQSFHDELLKKLGRIHNAAQARECYEWIRGAGFENVSFDLMFGIPGQTLREWKTDLRRALEMGPEHLSLYSLSVEPGTPFGHLRDLGALEDPSDDLVARMYEAAMDLTQAAGYHHYEISNYCLPGFECAHNLVYWNNLPYLGFGVSAASYVDGTRWTNTYDWDAYFEGAHRGQVPRVNEEKLRWNLALGEEIMLRLRTSAGISPARLSRKYRCDFEGLFRYSIDFLTRQDLLVREGDHLRLTRRGKLLANEVCREFLQSAQALEGGSH
ncbi:MAG: radical SAM family heme chaperone HemW [Acidobacteriota bacterium]